MTAGQNAAQLRRSNPAGMNVAVVGILAGAMAIGIVATVALARPAAVTPAAASVPVPPIEFRLSEHASLTPLSIPVPPIDFRLSEKDLTITAASSSIVGAHPLGRAADKAATVTTRRFELDGDPPARKGRQPGRTARQEHELLLALGHEGPVTHRRP